MIRRSSFAEKEHIRSTPELLSRISPMAGTEARQARDERGVPGAFTLIAASSKDTKNEPSKKLSFHFTSFHRCPHLSVQWGGWVLQLKTNAFNKIANPFFCGPRISLQNLAFFQTKSRNF